MALRRDAGGESGQRPPVDVVELGDALRVPAQGLLVVEPDPLDLPGDHPENGRRQQEQQDRPQSPEPDRPRACHARLLPRGYL